ILDYPRFGRQTVFWGECLKIQKRQLTRNELVALNFIILGISRFRFYIKEKGIPEYSRIPLSFILYNGSLSELVMETK
ncbi:hypothetical protein, partial [Bacteroides finegoldii]|uniref:hypothetical protein n=1 Tax=Bacteroides finegoldii TaxID=338188 RepID=UPI0032EDF13E